MWASKWLVTYLLTGYNTFVEAEEAFSYHTTNTTGFGSTFSNSTCIALNYGTFLFTPVSIICIVFVVYIIRKIKTSGLTGSNEMIPVIFPYAVLALAPVVWYIFDTQHSIFYFMTNKACSVTLMAILCCLADLRSRKVQ